MSIKKTPVCPFCGSEMKKMEESNVLPTRIAIEHQEGPAWWKILEYTTINAFKCENCNFIAFWRGNP